jgi:hypothetical protein
MYAITATSYRSVDQGMPLEPGETLVGELPPSLLHAIACAEARNQRDALLRACDWTQMVDAPLGAVALAQWTAYRQALRDFPSANEFPYGPWPQAPVGEQNGD